MPAQFQRTIRSLIILMAISVAPCAVAAPAQPDAQSASSVNHPTGSTSGSATTLPVQSESERAAKVGLIKALLESSRATRNAQLGYDTVIDQQMRGLQIALSDRIDKDSKNSPEQKQEAKRLLSIRIGKRMARAKQLMQEKINMTQLVSDSYIKLYDKYFTTQEIKDMLTWYQSATGQKVLDVLPAMTEEMTRLVNASLMPKLKELDDQLMAEEKEGKFNP
jgi:hypothetical protein